MESDDSFICDGERYFRIDGNDRLPEFFITLISPGDHWMFISSRGALTAGRKNPEHALFPYATVDKVMDGRGRCGPRTLIKATHQGRVRFWEPFASHNRQVWSIDSFVAKNREGSSLIFEERNADLGLAFRYRWAFSKRFGFIRSCWLRNESREAREIEWLDGLDDIMSSGVTRRLQETMSCLTDAYKDNVYDPDSGIAAFSLAALVTDKAEPLEALLANTVWRGDREGSEISLDPRAWDSFLDGRPFEPCRRACGRRGSFIGHRSARLEPGAVRGWHLAADVGIDHGALAGLKKELRDAGGRIEGLIAEEVAESRRKLVEMVARADGLCCSAKMMHEWHHFANVLFNIMRGGLPLRGERIERADFVDFVRIRQRGLASLAEAGLGAGETLDIRELRRRAGESGDISLARLAWEYLPLAFSRRHGDPSRPWNDFNIVIDRAGGGAFINYEGNWRDIFQNWEALGLSWPVYLESFLSIFLSSTTLDGYNPYRVSRQGIDWERVEPDNPWSNIGYWNDHQVIYLLKIAEALENGQPGRLAALMGAKRFSYAQVPYRIVPYERIRRDPRATIDFDRAMDEAIRARALDEGTDGRLVHDESGAVQHGSLIEKILTLTAAKIGNLVPDGGIWLNTQRPEWNDANNALVGNGLSLVSVGYLHRALIFWRDILMSCEEAVFDLPRCLIDLVKGQAGLMEEFAPGSRAGMDPRRRRDFMDAMGLGLERYRSEVYRDFRFSGRDTMGRDEIAEYLDSSRALCAATLRSQRRDDGLYHSYNILELSEKPSGPEARVRPLYLMLEGQVSILSSGLLAPREALDLLAALRRSALWREDQRSYMLYPPAFPADFFDRNRIPDGALRASPLLEKLVEDGAGGIAYRDAEGRVRFSSDLRNEAVLEAKLDALAADPPWRDLVASGRAEALAAYESAFHHSSFTGRSSAMYAYEGIGSIYWHMVAKLLLAVSELRDAAFERREAEPLRRALERAYLEIRQGIGYQKTALLWGAFPWDSYSHTPWAGGAQQPGMTGQVKEEILTRLAEFGIRIRGGRIEVLPGHLLEGEFLEEPRSFGYIDAAGRSASLELEAGECAMTLCQLPFVRRKAEEPGRAPRITLSFADGRREEGEARLSRELSESIFARSGKLRFVRIG